MLAILSPAKTLDLSRIRDDLPVTSPALWAESQRMMIKAKNISRRRLQSLMGISKALAETTWQRHQQFETPFTPSNSHRAALCFAGEVYFGLDARTVPAADMQWAQDRVAILSGLFGILRPLDLIQPYRMEMGARIASRRGKNLYDFWGASVTDRINDMTASHADRVVVNLASKEYASAVQSSRLKAGLINVAFKEIKPAGAKVIGVVAKRSRGKMARWMIDHRVDRIEGIKDFNVDDYRFDPTLSGVDTFTFTRPHVPGRMVAQFQARKARNTQFAQVVAPRV